jgi:hypothetical protein
VVVEVDVVLPSRQSTNHFLPRTRKQAYKIDIVRPQILQTPLHTRMYVLRTVAREVTLDQLISEILILSAGKLCSDNDLVSTSARLDPLAQPLLTLAEMVVHSSVDEVAALAVEVVEHGESSLFGALAQRIFPGIAEVHGTKAERGDPDAGGGGEDAVAAEDGGGFGGWRESHGRESSLTKLNIGTRVYEISAVIETCPRVCVVVRCVFGRSTWIASSIYICTSVLLLDRPFSDFGLRPYWWTTPCKGNSIGFVRRQLL